MTPFDPIKACGEELAGLTDVHRVLAARVRETERKLAESEAEHNSLLKLERFVADLVEAQRARLHALQEEAERRTRGETSDDGRAGPT